MLGSASLMSNNIFLELNKMNNPSFIEKVPHRVVDRIERVSQGL